MSKEVRRARVSGFLSVPVKKGSSEEKNKENVIEKDREKSNSKKFANFDEAIKDIETRRKEKGTLSQTAIIAREVDRQSSLSAKNKISSGKLLDFIKQSSDLTEEEKKNIILYEAGKGVLPALEEGIEGGELVSKVIIALAITLYEQSELYGTTRTLTGATERLLPLFDDENLTETRNSATSGRPSLSGNLVESPCPVILLEIGKFTKLVLGIDTEPRAKDKKRVREVLDALRTKKIFVCSEDRRKIISTTIIGKQRIEIALSKYKDQKTGEIEEKYTEVYRLIELDSIFTKSILNDYAVIRKDTLKVLRGRQSRLTMKLFHFLLVQYSYHEVDTYKKAKRELYDIIAVGKRYKEHPEERDADLLKAVAKMQQLHLITPIKNDKKLDDPKRGGYYENIGQDGQTTFCHFVFNTNYENEAYTSEGKEK